MNKNITSEAADEAFLRLISGSLVSAKFYGKFYAVSAEDCQAQPNTFLKKFLKW